MDYLSDYRSEIENLLRLGLIVEKEDGDYALTEMGRLVAIEAERGEMAVLTTKAEMLREIESAIESAESCAFQLGFQLTVSERNAAIAERLLEAIHG